MANFGIFAGGLADSYQKQTEQNSVANYRTQELKIQQQAQQNAMQRDQMARIDKIRGDAMTEISNSVEQLKIAGKNNTEISQLLTPWVQQVAKLAKSSGVDDSAVFAQFSAELAKPSQAETTKTLAAAKEPPGQAELRSAQAAYYRGQASLFSGTDQPGLTGGQPSNAGGQTVRTANGNVAEIPPPLGQGNDMYEPQPVAPDTQQPAASGSKYISSSFTPRQKAIIFQSGATPEQFDFDATMYAYGNTNVATGYRSYHGVNPVTVLRSRAAQYWMDKGLSPQDANGVMVEFKAMQHGTNTAATIDARMTAALAKAENTAKIVLPLSEKVDRTEYKDLNNIVLAAKERTGDQNVVRLGIALETLASNYGVSLGMGNSVLTDFQTQRAMKLLQIGWSKGQLGAAVDQIMQEMNREEAGVRQGLHSFIGGMTNDMQNPGQVSAPAAGSGAKPNYKFNPNTGELEAQ